MAALAAPFYQGDYVVKTTCNQETLFLGTVKVGGFSVGTAPWVSQRLRVLDLYNFMLRFVSGNRRLRRTYRPT